VYENYKFLVDRTCWGILETGMGVSGVVAKDMAQSRESLLETSSRKAGGSGSLCGFILYSVDIWEWLSRNLEE
jgi:hypothetical protein